MPVKLQAPELKEWSVPAVQTFFWGCEKVYKVQAADTPDMWVLYTASRLSVQEACNAYSRYVQKGAAHEPPIPEEKLPWAPFVAHMTAEVTRLDCDNFFTKYDNERKRKNKETIRAYIARLEAFFARWEYTDPASYPSEQQIVTHFIDDLPASIQGNVRAQKPKDFTTACEHARFFSTDSDILTMPFVPSASTSTAEPMDLSFLASQPEAAAAFFTQLSALFTKTGAGVGGGGGGCGRGKLSTEERERRFNNKLCIACGSASHWRGHPDCHVSGRKSGPGGRGGRGDGRGGGFSSKLHALELQLGKQALAAHLNALSMPELQAVVVQEENKSGND